MSTILRNSRSGQIVASAIELALTRSARRRGLLRRTALDPATALVLAPCVAVHTAFMQFAIDVIFVDRTGRVRRIVRGLQPWRVAASRHAYATIELAAGALDSRDVAVGDRLYLETADGRERSLLRIAEAWLTDAPSRHQQRPDGGEK